ncbi:MAG: hypothetical protein Tsb005_17900 [Gammaproteobacteria bacterium]
MNDSNELNNAEHVSQNKKSKKKKPYSEKAPQKKNLTREKELIWVLKDTGIGYIKVEQDLLQAMVSMQFPNHDTLKLCTIKNSDGHSIVLEKIVRNSAAQRKRVWKNDEGKVTKIPLSELLTNRGDYLSNLTQKGNTYQKLYYTNEGKEDIFTLSTKNQRGIWVYKGTGYRFTEVSLSMFANVIDVKANKASDATKQKYHVQYDTKQRTRQFTISSEEGDKKICLERLWFEQHGQIEHHWYFSNNGQQYKGSLPSNFENNIHLYSPTFNDNGELQTVTIPDGANTTVLKLKVAFTPSNRIINKEVTVIKGTGLGYRDAEQKILQRALAAGLISIGQTEKKTYIGAVNSKNIWLDKENRVVNIPFEELISNLSQYNFTYDKNGGVTIKYQNKLLTLVSRPVANRLYTSVNLSTDNNNERPVEYLSEDEGLEVSSKRQKTVEDSFLKVVSTNILPLSSSVCDSYIEVDNIWENSCVKNDLDLQSCIIPVGGMLNETLESEKVVVPSTSTVSTDQAEWEQGFFEGLEYLARLEVDTGNNLSTSDRHDSVNGFANQVANQGFFASNNRQGDKSLVNQRQALSSAANSFMAPTNNSIFTNPSSTKSTSAFFESQHGSNIFNADLWSVDYPVLPQDPNTGENNNEDFDFDSVLNFDF